MKFKILVEYEYPIEHKLPVKAEIVLHGDRVVTDNIKWIEQESKLDKIRAEIMDCLKALDDIEKFNIYLPNEISGRRLTYQQCLEIFDKYKAESKDT